MMRFVLIDPKAKRAWEARYPDLGAALHAVGLRSGEVDHGTIWRRGGFGLAIVVYQYGMFDPPETRGLFSLASRLYAGSAVVYGFDAKGATINVELYQLPPVVWHDARSAQAAMARGALDPVRIAVDDEELWRWPQPGGQAAAREAGRRLAAEPARDVIIDGDSIIKQDGER